MTERFTINRQFHVATKRSGTKQIQSGAKPVISAGGLPRISGLLDLAHHCFRQVQSRVIINQSELVHFGQFSPTRMTQILWLDKLAPDIQEEVLFLPRSTQGRDVIKEAGLRPMAETLDWSMPRQIWQPLEDALSVNQPGGRVVGSKVWADEQVAESVHANFIPVAMDVDNPDDAAVLARYKIGDSPVTIVADPEGNVLRWREGGLEESEFLEFLNASNSSVAEDL